MCSTMVVFIASAVFPRTFRGISLAVLSMQQGPGLEITIMHIRVRLQLRLKCSQSGLGYWRILSEGWDIRRLVDQGRSNSTASRRRIRPHLSATGWGSPKVNPGNLDFPTFLMDPQAEMAFVLNYCREAAGRTSASSYTKFGNGRPYYPAHG